MTIVSIGIIVIMCIHCLIFNRVQDTIVLQPLNQVYTDAQLSRRPSSVALSDVLIPLLIEDGIYQCPIVIGNQLMYAVIDTGSDKLLVGADSCKGCRGRKFSISRSPTVRKRDISDEVMEFGTQVDTVSYYTDDLLLVGTQLSKASLPWNSTCHPIIDIPTIRFGLVLERTGASNFNIMGLSDTVGMGDVSFLKSILKDQENHIFTIYMHHENSFINFGGSARMMGQCLQPPTRLNFIPLVNSSQLMVKFYMIEIDRMELNGIPYMGIKYVLFDTGSNLSATGPKTFRVLEKAMRSGQTISFFFRTTTDTEASIEITKDVYMWHDSPESLLVEPHEPFADHLLNDSIFVLGSLFLQEFMLSFDLQNQTIGIAKSKLRDT